MPVGITTNVNCGLGKSKSKGQPGNLVHNRREFDPYNIDPNLAVNNILFANRSLKETYEVAFGDSIDEHNSKQKRKDRNNFRQHLRIVQQRIVILATPIVQAAPIVIKATAARIQAVPVTKETAVHHQAAVPVLNHQAVHPDQKVGTTLGQLAA